MKNYFLLYFLVLSPLLFSQNGYRFAMENYSLVMADVKSNQILSNSHKNIVILDKDFSAENNNPLMLEVNSIEYTPDNFSSFELMEQLEALNNRSPFNVVHNPTLERFIRVYLYNRREVLSDLMGRSEYYFPMIEEHLDKYNLPLEIKYLAIVESALKARASSPAGAKGLWQFMFTTGKQYNLEVNYYVDDRFDPIKSTKAACEYLSVLYEMFNDWDLALAAYNSGAGNVKKAIRRSGGKKNYWQIRNYLPEETRAYVPAFYATYYIFEFADKHDLKPTTPKLTYFEVDTVHIKNPLHFDIIKKNISINDELLRSLNPQYKKDYIPSSVKKNYFLTLPLNLVSEFVEKENLIYSSNIKSNNEKNNFNTIKISRSNSYKVENGDNLKNIASKFNINIDQLKKLNGLQTDFLIVGQRLVITDKKEKSLEQPNTLTIHNNNAITDPFSPKVSPNFSSKANIDLSSGTNKSYEIYIVKEGDTLFNISRKFSKVTIEQIRNWNNLVQVSYLKPGTKLIIYKS